MAHAPILPQDRTARRTVKALGICDRQECELLDNGLWRVRDTQTGSGRWHIADDQTCDCYDATRGTCKHVLAVRREEAALATYCDQWNAHSDAQRDALTPEDLDWLTDDVNRDEYRGPYGSDGWPAPRPCCPECGAELECRSYWVGGKGYTAFLCCTKDAEHQALPA